MLFPRLARARVTRESGLLLLVGLTSCLSVVGLGCLCAEGARKQRGRNPRGTRGCRKGGQTKTKRGQP